MKKYDTGKDSWRHEESCMYENGTPTHKLLGPCPICGGRTFDYGGGWRCTGTYCKNNENNPISNIGS